MMIEKRTARMVLRAAGEEIRARWRAIEWLEEVS